MHRQKAGYTLAEARKLLQGLGLVLTRNQEWETYRVNYRGGREGTAYYCDQLDDAVGTGISMAKNFVKCAWKECPTVEWCTRCKSCQKHCREYGCGA